MYHAVLHLEWEFHCLKFPIEKCTHLSSTLHLLPQCLVPPSDSFFLIVSQK